jgi:uncharacterized protein YfaT (DUF1175 family)
MFEPRITILFLALWGFLAFFHPSFLLHSRPSTLLNLAGPAQPETDQPRHSGPSASTDDRFADGTPDFLRLDAPSDQETFRRWFALIAEFQALRPSNEVPGEINDCAALLRYSYRNALRTHDAGWFREAQIAPPSALPSLEKYRYPHTPLGAALFRIRPGAFRAEDLKNGTFAEFADAKTLKDFNMHFLSRDIRAARPGDLLFYRQLEQDSPFHSMIFVGRSRGFRDPARKAARTWSSITLARSAAHPVRCVGSPLRNSCSILHHAGGLSPATAISWVFSGGTFFEEQTSALETDFSACLPFHSYCPCRWPAP